MFQVLIMLLTCIIEILSGVLWEYMIKDASEEIFDAWAATQDVRVSLPVLLLLLAWEVGK